MSFSEYDQINKILLPSFFPAVLALPKIQVCRTTNKYYFGVDENHSNYWVHMLWINIEDSWISGIIRHLQVHKINLFWILVTVFTLVRLTFENLQGTQLCTHHISTRYLKLHCTYKLSSCLPLPTYQVYTITTLLTSCAEQVSSIALCILLISWKLIKNSFIDS